MNASRTGNIGGGDVMSTDRSRMRERMIGREPRQVCARSQYADHTGHDAFVMAAVAHAIELRDAVVVTGNRLAVDNEGPRAQAGEPWLLRRNPAPCPR